MIDNFDWNASSDCIVQQAVETLAVYQNPHGDIVLRQQQQWDEERDTFIVVAQANAQRVADAILRAAELQHLTVAEKTPTPSGDRTGAERQRNRKRNAERDAPVTEAVTERPQLKLVG